MIFYVFRTFVMRNVFKTEIKNTFVNKVTQLAFVSWPPGICMKVKNMRCSMIND